MVEEIILKDFSSSLEEKSPQQKTRLWKEISSSFNFEEMSKRSLGKQWNNLYPEQKNEFVGLFTKNLRSSYLRNSVHLFIDKIVSIEERQGKKHAKVQTELLTKRGREISVVFYLLNRDEDWKIFDVTIEGVSLVNNYHSQFQSVIVRTSYDGLIEKMREKHDDNYFASEYELLVSERAKRTY
ncbi:MAG: toluene tolerance protein [Candidatus Scalindua sp.]|nr:MAG: toluene tolerance protein [Candidatus Scalindua sp.]